MLFTKGLPGRLSVEAAAINQAVDTNYRCAISDYLAFGRSRACVMNLPSRNPADADVVLLGNSHAQMYAPVWTSIIAGRGQTGLLVPVNGCLPTVQANISRDCTQIARDNLAEISKLARVRTVIIGLSWVHKQGELIDSSGRPVDDIDNRALISALDDLIDRLQRMGKQVVLIGPIAEPGWNVASTLSRQLAFGHAPIARRFCRRRISSGVSDPPFNISSRVAISGSHAPTRYSAPTSAATSCLTAARCSRTAITSQAPSCRGFAQCLKRL